MYSFGGQRTPYILAELIFSMSFALAVKYTVGHLHFFITESHLHNLALISVIIGWRLCRQKYSLRQSWPPAQSSARQAGDDLITITFTLHNIFQADANVSRPNGKAEVSSLSKEVFI